MWVTKKRRILICLTGVDGSGKTTHAKHLLEFLTEKGYASKYVWAGSRPVFLYLFLGVTRILGYWKTVKKGDWMDPLEKAPLQVRRRLGLFYRFLLYVDFEMITCLKIRVPLSMGKIVICDRYIYDLIMDLSLAHHYTSTYGKMLMYTTPVPKRVFSMDAELDTIIRRRPGSNQDRILGKKIIYRKLAEALDFMIIDTLMTFDANQELMRREINSLLNDGQH